MQRRKKIFAAKKDRIRGRSLRVLREACALREASQRS
jgi:hypothetical protein